MSLNRNKLRENFLSEYKDLNDQQRLAVVTIEGPVMVIAGPGTGKTQILACRIGKILLETDASPENILCLTYTDAGVVAMRKRLLKFIGPDAYKVNIYTFHAFCNDVIQDNLTLFEKTSMDAISELEKIELFKKLIDSLPKNHPLKRYRGDVYFEAKNLESLFSNMKREGWTAEYFNEKIDEYIKELPNNSAYIYKRKQGDKNAGDLKPEYYTELERIEKTKAAVNEFYRYKEMMRKMNRYDFDDMITWVLKVFSENANVLANYQEKFQYILVDEYQDTSGSQNQLVQLLINYWDKPNVFVVGDDDQSIYRFQGANVENMLGFAKQYEEDLLKIVLTNNYRSTQPILDTSKALIERNTERLTNQIEGLNKNLTSSNKEINIYNNSPVVREYNTQREEMIDIVEKAEALIAKGVKPGDIGIIYKEHKYGEELTKYFSLLKIPVYSKRNLNALELPLAIKLITILKYLASEHFIPYSGDQLLFEILHFDWFNISPIEIAKTTIQVAERKYEKNKTSIRSLMQEKINSPADDLFSKNISEEMKSASEIIERLISKVSNLTLQNLFEEVIREAGVISSIMKAPDKHWQLQVLTALFDFVKDETHRNPALSLQELVSLIELMETEKIPISLIQVNGSEKGINLMTAHGSKGLEFEHVFIVGANATLWEKKKANNKGFKIPSTVFTTNAAANDNQELRRLFYVAVTRAKIHLNISYSKFKNDGKEIEPSMFIAEIQDSYDLPFEKTIVSEESIVRFATLNFEEGLSPEIAQLDDDIITPILERFSMNVTALNSYLKCPLSFYYNNFIRIPSAKNESTEFGSAVHYALHMLFDGMQKNDKKEFPSKPMFIEFFEYYMNRHRESFSKEQFDRRIEYGHEILGKYYDSHIDSFNKVVALEHRINTVINNVPIKGAMDKLEFDGNAVNVVDYKSGDPDKGIKKLQGPSDKSPNGEDYWRQAVFYKILIDNKTGKDWKAVSTEFDFIEPDKNKKYIKKKIVITPEDIATVKNQITVTWEKIQNREFYTGCRKSDCEWCEFVKTNKLAVRLHEKEPEED